MGFHKIAEILGSDFLLVVTGILISILTTETVFLVYLIYWAGGIRNLFTNTLKIYNNRINNSANKRDKTTPRIDEKKGLH